MLIQFDFRLEMGIFLLEMLNFLDYFLYLELILFVGNLVIRFKELLLKSFDFFTDVFVVVFLHLQFLLEL